VPDLIIDRIDGFAFDRSCLFQPHDAVARRAQSTGAPRLGIYIAIPASLTELL
jgi:hypothetical protein